MRSGAGSGGQEPGPRRVRRVVEVLVHRHHVLDRVGDHPLVPSPRSAASADQAASTASSSSGGTADAASAAASGSPSASASCRSSRAPSSNGRHRQLGRCGRVRARSGCPGRTAPARSAARRSVPVRGTAARRWCRCTRARARRERPGRRRTRCPRSVPRSPARTPAPGPRVPARPAASRAAAVTARGVAVRAIPVGDHRDPLQVVLTVRDAGVDHLGEGCGVGPTCLGRRRATGGGCRRSGPRRGTAPGRAAASSPTQARSWAG